MSFDPAKPAVGPKTGTKPAPLNDAGVAGAAGSPVRAAAVCLLLATLVGLLGANGFFRPLDDQLTVARARLLDRPLTGSIATVEIDSDSLRKIGVWPWPRGVHAALLDRLMAMGARSVVFDIDFSARSDPASDAAFAAALHRAGGYAALAAFEQPAGANGGTVVNLPIEALAREAEMAAVDVPTDSDNVVRRYETMRPVAGRLTPTVGALLSGVAQGGAGAFTLNVALDLRGLDRLSAAAVLDGSAEAARIKGKDIIIGASAEELRDFFFVPRFGLIPGASIHALAGETLRQDLALAPWTDAARHRALFAVAALGALLSGARIRPFAFAFAALAVFAVEGSALAAQVWLKWAPLTAEMDVLTFGLAAAAALADLSLRRKLHRLAARERDMVQAMLATVVADNFDGVVVIDDSGTVIAASRFADELVGPGLKGANGLAVLPGALSAPLREAFGALRAGHSRPVAQGECAIGGPEARHLVEYVVTASRIGRDPARSVACVTLRDVTQRREAEAKLDYVAKHDGLTGALLRGELLKRMNFRLGQGAELTVVRVDLRRFEVVNEIFGHAAGDSVLRAAMGRLAADRPGMVARLSGDGFALVVEGPAGAEALSALGARLAQALSEPYRLGENVAIAGAVAGVTTTALSGRDAETLLIHAAMAQASVKAGSGADQAVFSTAFEAQRREKQEIDRAMRLALGTAELTLGYQPKIDLKTGRIAGAEALLRWRRADGSWVSPGQFIPIAEESGFIVEVGRWALNRACREAARWPGGLGIAVNVSPIQLAATDFYAEVEAALARTGLDPRRLELELTEGVFVEEASHVSKTLGRLRALGVTIAIDDFGTGYSSLQYLGRLPIDVIKVDRAFVTGIPQDERAIATVGAILSLAATHGKKVVAEGVETLEQAQALRLASCDYAQGFLFGAAMTGEELLRAAEALEKAA